MRHDRGKVNGGDSYSFTGTFHRDAIGPQGVHLGMLVECDQTERGAAVGIVGMVGNIIAIDGAFVQGVTVDAGDYTPPPIAAAPGETAVLVQCITCGFIDYGRAYQFTPSPPPMPAMPGTDVIPMPADMVVSITQGYSYLWGMRRIMGLSNVIPVTELIVSHLAYLVSSGSPNDVLATAAHFFAELEHHQQDGLIKELRWAMANHPVIRPYFGIRREG